MSHLLICLRDKGVSDLLPKSTTWVRLVTTECMGGFCDQAKEESDESIEPKVGSSVYKKTGAISKSLKLDIEICPHCQKDDSADGLSRLNHLVICLKKSGLAGMLTKMPLEVPLIAMDCNKLCCQMTASGNVRSADMSQSLSELDNNLGGQSNSESGSEAGTSEMLRIRQAMRITSAEEMEECRIYCRFSTFFNAAYLLEAIDAELNGNKKEGSNLYLERHLCNYADFVMQRSATMCVLMGKQVHKLQRTALLHSMRKFLHDLQE